MWRLPAKESRLANWCSVLRDIVINLVGFSGIFLMCAGVWLQYGMPWAFICGGVTMCATAAIAGIRHSHVLHND